MQSTTSLSSREHTLATTVLTSPDELGALRPEWETLWHQCSTATVFQHPAWCIPWFQHVCEGSALVVCVREDQRLTCLAPFAIVADLATGERQLRLAGTGISDHLDVLVAPDADAGCAKAVLQAAGGAQDLWDVAYLDQLSAHSPLLTTPAPFGWESQTYPRDACPVVQLPGVPVTLESVVHSGLLKRVAYARRRASRTCALDIAQADHDSLASILNALFELHALRWRIQGEAGVFAEPRVQAFHNEAAAELLQAGLLRCYALRLDDRIAGVYYGFNAHRRACAYIGGFDPDLHSLSIGNLLIARALGDALRESSVEFDFLRGREDYKYVWGATDTPTFGRRLVPTKVGGSLLP